MTDQNRILVASSCPNCGAPVEENSFQCEYCGSKFVRIGATGHGTVQHTLENMIQEELELNKILIAQSLQRSVLTPNQARSLFGFHKL